MKITTLVVITVRWCKGSTRDFGSLGLGSNPGGTTKYSQFNLLFYHSYAKF